MGLAQQLLASGVGVNGSAFMVSGMNSSDDAMFIDDRAYFSAMNIVNRGGYVQTRPGYRCLFTLPDGNLQGMCYFRPLNSVAFLVFAVEGKVYASKYPFNGYARLPGIQFYKAAKNIYWAVTLKSVQQSDDGQLTLIDPIRVLVMQDGGYTRAAYWDGTTSRHLDPSPSPTKPVKAATVGPLVLTGVATSIDQQPLVNGDRVLVKNQTNPAENGVYTYQLGVETIYTTDPNKLGVLTRATDAATDAQLTLGTSYFVSFGAQNQNTRWEIGAPAPTVLGASPVYFVKSSKTTNFSETPLGEMMAWSGDRLWVARGNRLFASDLEDPLKFTENIYFAEGGSFFTAEPITGMAEIPGLKTPQLAVFTNTMTYVLASGVRDRTTWKAYPNFQAVLFPSVGCTSHRSICSQFGLLWWMTPTGITNFNAAQQAQITSTLAPMDVAMAVSKGNLSPNVEQVCSGTFENYGLFSMPSGSRRNKHTWIMDRAVVAAINESSSATWNSFWTGTFPVEWASGPVNNVQRIFHVSPDPDGKNRLWEAFIADRRDNSLPITSYVETKTHIDFSPKATGLDKKRLLFAEVNFTEMYGDVSCTIFWAGLRGVYKKLAEFNWTATEGELTEGVEVTMQDELVGYRPQSRTVRAPEIPETNTIISPASVGGIESKTDPDYVDIGFSLLIVWSGRAALRSYRIFARPQEETGVGGACPIDDKGDKIVIDQMSTYKFKG
jgi:hypothetical protein